MSFIVKTVLYDQPERSEHWSRGEHTCYINKNIGTNNKVASTVTQKFQKAWSQHFEDQFRRGTGLYRFFQDLKYSERHKNIMQKFKYWNKWSFEGPQQQLALHNWLCTWNQEPNWRRWRGVPICFKHCHSSSSKYPCTTTVRTSPTIKDKAQFTSDTWLLFILPCGITPQVRRHCMSQSGFFFLLLRDAGSPKFSTHWSAFQTEGPKPVQAA